MENSFKQNRYYRRLVDWTNMHFPVFVAKMRYRMLFRKKLHLNPPVNLNEKIQWLSLFTDTTLWTKLADKYAVREYIEEKGYGHTLVKLYGKWSSAEEIEWEKLPSSFVLKTNHGCGAVWIIEDKAKINRDSITKALNASVREVYGLATTEMHYSRIERCIIAEQLLIPTEKDLMMSSSLIDYKFWCMNGRVEYIWVVSNRHHDYFDGTMFDRDWKPVKNVVRDDVKHVHIPIRLVERPAMLQEMIIMAEKLSEPFPEVRVDLYYVGDKIYFGEMTFTTHGGTIDYMTEQHLLKMGEKIDLSGMHRTCLNKPVKS